MQLHHYWCWNKLAGHLLTFIVLPLHVFINLKRVKIFGGKII